MAVFVKDIWSVTELFFPFNQAEVVVLRVSAPSLSLVLFSIYRPPCCNGRLFLVELDSALSSLSCDDLICINGDININILRPTMTMVADYLDVFSKWGIKTTINKATREEFLSGQLVISSIDHINVRAQNFIVQSAIIETKLADHFVCCSLTQPHTSTTIISEKEFSIVEPRLFDKLIVEHDWNSFLLAVSPGDTYEQFVAQMNLFKRAATRMVKIKQRKQDQKWMSSEILVAIKEKDLLWAQSKRSPGCVSLRLNFKQSIGTR